MRLDRCRDGAAGIDALEMQSVQLAWIVLEVPPRDAVLRADDNRLGAEQLAQLRRQLREAVRFYGQENHIGGANGREVPGDHGLYFEVAIRARDAQTAFLHRAQVRTAREQHDVCAGVGESCADVPANRPRAGDDDSHELFSANTFATTPRWIFPVAVRGMFSVI